jgi:hypothetical protein
VAEQSSEPPRNTKRAAPPPPLGLVEGTVWRFTGTHVRHDDASNADVSEPFTWQTEVVSDDKDGDRRRWRVKGWPVDAVGWDGTPPPVSETTIVLDDDVLYVVDDATAAPSRQDAWLRWPPHAGDEVCPDEDSGSTYCWTVAASGKEFAVTLRTGPDDMTYTVDPKRGVVRFEYHHHGTTNDVVLERSP